MNPWSWASNCVENRVFWPTRNFTQMGPLWLYNSQTRAERRSFSAMIALYSSPILTVHPWRAHVQQQQYTLLLLFLKYTVCVDNKEHYWYILTYKIKNIFKLMKKTVWKVVLHPIIIVAYKKNNPQELISMRRTLHCKNK